MPDVDEFRTRLRLYELLEKLDITGRIRDEMIREPERALRVLEASVRARGVRNRAALAVSRWQSPALEAPAPAPRPRPTAVDVPPPLSELEHVWSFDPNVQEIVLPLLAKRIERHGGFEKLK